MNFGVGERRRWAVVIASAVFLGVLVARIVVSPEHAVGVAFVIPIALIAAELGRTAGVGTAALASAAIVIWAMAADAEFSSLDYASRLVSFVVVGGLVGHFSDRCRCTMGKVAAMAQTDPLTGLPNRRALYENLERDAARAQREEQRLAVVMIDIDRFKEFNDTHGHQAADALLQQATAAWRTALRRSDLLARYAGDEFVMILPDCPVNYAEAVLERIRVTNGTDCNWSAGIAYQEGGEETAESLLARADAALLAAKRAGRNHAVTSRISNDDPPRQSANGARSRRI